MDYQYSELADVINATRAEGFGAGDEIRAGGGDDHVTLGAGVFYVSGPGHDSVTAPDPVSPDYRGGAYIAFWQDPGAVEVNLEAGWALDGFGFRDTLSGHFQQIHLPRGGGSIIGSKNDEEVVFFSGSADLDLGEGYDAVTLWEIASTDFAITRSGVEVLLTGSSDTIRALNVEELRFIDAVIFTGTSGDGPYVEVEYRVLETVETDRAPGYWYEGEYNPPALVSSFPQAVTPVDLGADGDLDLILPVNRGYRTGIDTRIHFQVLENTGGELRYDPALTEQTPFIAGTRRMDTLFVEQFESDVLVSVAHDTAIEAETRFDIPWRLGDIALLRLDDLTNVTGQLVPGGTLPHVETTGRDTAVDAHSLAIGDINNDGLEDILVGDWNQVFALLQNEQGAFGYWSNSDLSALNGWVDPDLEGSTPALLIDLHLADLNGDGADDLVAGWGHATVRSRIFFNDGSGGFSPEDSEALPASVYGADNSLHLKTFSEDFDRDGDQDLIILHSRYVPFYSGNYLQYLSNDGHGGFTDDTSRRLGDPLLEATTLADGWSDHWHVLDVNGDGFMDLAGNGIDFDGSAIVYLNDGAGVFDRYEIALPAQTEATSWGDFDSDGKLEIAAWFSIRNDGAGTSSTNAIDLLELNLGGVVPGVTKRWGTSVDDFLTVGPGSLIVDAGEGEDTAHLPLFVTEFSLQEEAPGKVVGTYDDWSLEFNDVELLEFGTGHQTTIPIADVVSGEAQEKVQKLSDLYLAFFGRAPDIEGLEYWQEVILEKGLDLIEISQYFAESDEAQALYPADASNREFVRNIYLNAFSREPDQGGWDFWTEKLDALDPSDLAARGAFVGTVILAAYSPTSGPRDLGFLSNRHEVSLGYVNRLLLEPEEGKDKAITDLLMLVTDDDATVVAAEELLDYVFEDPVTLTGVMTDQAAVDSFFG
jgi:hypothetical protein